MCITFVMGLCWVNGNISLCSDIALLSGDLNEPAVLCEYNRNGLLSLNQHWAQTERVERILETVHSIIYCLITDFDR